MKIGILSDIHEDVTSLTLALQILDEERCDQVVSLGDIIGFDNGYYGASRVQDAEACIRLIQDHCTVSVAGNHDLFAIKKLPEYKAGFDYPSHWYSIPLEERQRLAKNRLWSYSPEEDQAVYSQPSQVYLSGLPEFAIEEFDGIRILFSHHIYPDFSGSLRKMPAWSPDIWAHLNFMKQHHCQIGISGHVHVEGILRGNWYHLQSSRNTTLHLNGGRRWITSPPVTVGGVTNGFLIFDTESCLITARHLNSVIPT